MNHDPSPSTRVQPGNCANPKGRSVTERLLSLLERNEFGGKPLPTGKQLANVVAEVIVREALKADYRFVQLLMDRVNGKAPDRISIGTDGTTQAIRDYLLGRTDPPAEGG